VPPRDSTAYIVAKYVMPPLIRNKTKYIEEPGIRRNMYYTVGWRDKPLAKVVVCANEIMAYVSPRELEDFEYREYLAAEDERVRLEALAVKPKAKRSRPRKGPAAAVEAAELARLMEIPNISVTSEDELGANKKAGEPSLSTPSRRGLVDALGIGDSEISTGEDEAAVNRQLYGESEDAFDAVAPSGDEMDVDSDMPAALPSFSSGAEQESSRASSLALLPVPGAAALSRPSPVPPAKPKYSTSPIPLPPIPQRSQPNQSQSSVMPSSFATNIPQLIPSAEYYSAAKPAAKRKRQKSNGDEQPLPKPGAGLRSRASATSPTKSKPPEKSTIPATPNQLPPSQAANGPSVKAQLQAELSGRTSGFTPLQRTHSLSQPAVQASSTVRAAVPSSTQGSQSPKKKKQKKKKTKEPALSENVWEVLRLEADRHDYDAEGNLVHYYKVRWEGDWPEDQNPTWEPESNIDSELVADYLKKKEKKNGSVTRPSPAKSKTMPPKYFPKKRYSNVAEAFEGELDEMENHVSSHERHDEEEDDGEEKFVVSEDMGTFGDFDQGLARY
jgi:hypothetical protein